ncbi:MAG: insulinase family protein [Desulfobacterota bacterium]|nr:insulinase family protein [Thermodesulfobacteriota bacterium]
MIEKTVLSNGVRILTETLPEMHSVAIGIWIAAGSRHEQEHENGLAHFIEHMLFKGTARYSAADIARMVDAVGGVFNAFTAKEYTCLYIKVLHQHSARAMEVLCDIFFHSLFHEAEIEKERNVILQEISMVRDTPDDYIHDLLGHVYFGRHPLGRAILGNRKSVCAFSRQHIVDFYAREYLVPERIIIAAAGRIEHSRMLDWFGGRFEHLSGTAVPYRPAPPPRFKTVFYYRNLEQVHICFGIPGVSHQDPGRYAFAAANAILGGSMSSRLFQEIRENRGLAYAVYSCIASFHDAGVLCVYLGIPPAALPEALPIVQRELSRMCDEQVSVEELNTAKEQLKGNLLLGLESTDSRMSRLAKCELYYGMHLSVQEIIASIDALTAEDLQMLMRMLFDNGRYACVVLGPVKKDDAAAHALLTQ